MFKHVKSVVIGEVAQAWFLWLTGCSRECGSRHSRLVADPPSDTQPQKHPARLPSK